MAISTSILRACVALSLAAVAIPCASQSNGALTQAVIQGAVNALFGGLGSKPAPAASGSTSEGNPSGATASGITPVAPSESSFKDILVASSDARWPRVAVTITALQATAYDSIIMTRAPGWDPNHIPPHACMRLSAVVWSDLKKSRTIPEETFCASQMQRGVSIGSNGDMLAWGAFADTSNQNTGHARTNGPKPPAKLFPEGSDYKDFFNSSLAAATFGVLMRMMGYDLSIEGGKDRRLWVVSAPSKGEILSGQKVLR